MDREVVEQKLESLRKSDWIALDHLTDFPGFAASVATRLGQGL